MNVIKYLLFYVAAALIVTITFALIYNPGPDIHWSTAEDKCVKVISENPKHTCKNFPKKYNKIPVR